MTTSPINRKKHETCQYNGILRNKKELYRVVSIVKRFPHRGWWWKDVIVWIFDVIDSKREKPIVPYEIAIKNYAPDTPDIFYAEIAIDELFTREEAEQLKSYLENYSNLTTKIETIKLPIRNKNVVGFSAFPLGGRRDRIMLYKTENYPLSFNVLGSYKVEEEIEQIEKEQESEVVS